MAPKTKINLKDRFEDGELDLSLSELQEVPVREIAAIKKATSLDLSNNRLINLGKNFVTLTHIIKLDLGKNLLTELPENFGDMRQLKHLDLYHNQLTHLPLSFHQLKNLRWLDLKDNPLVPAVAKVSGPCLDQQQCTQCAKNVVQFFATMCEQIEEEKQRREKEMQLELEVELANQKKQQKKKEKNKALKVKKSKMKAERKLQSMNAIENEHLIDYVKQPVNSVNQQQHTNNNKKTKQQSSSSLMKKMFLFCAFFAVSLFVFTTIRHEYAIKLKQESLVVWRKFVHSAVPDGLQPCVREFSNYFEVAHNVTGKFLDNSFTYIQELRHHENTQILLDFLQGVYSYVVSEGGKLFHILGDQAIVLRNEIKKYLSNIFN